MEAMLQEAGRGKTPVIMHIHMEALKPYEMLVTSKENTDLLPDSAEVKKTKAF